MVKVYEMYYPFVRPITEKHCTKKIGIRIDKTVKYEMKRKTTESVIIYVFSLIYWNAAVI